MIDLNSLIDVKTGQQSRRAFADRDVYELELKQIFARCWQFLGHECAIPNVGDFVTAMMGEDEVIVVRQRDRTIKAFLNACRHRGSQVCAAEAGNSRGFVCTYHGWAYGLDGALEGVPLEKEAYKSKLDKAKLGLMEVPLVESFHGFVFGCFDVNAPSFRDYLGDMAWYLDIWMDANGGAELIGPPSRSILNCNWKTPAENFVGDAYHAGWTHASSLKVLNTMLTPLIGNVGMPSEGTGVQVTTRHGHGVGIIWDAAASALGDLAPEFQAWQAKKKPMIEKKLGPLQAKLYGSHFNSTIFPNCSYLWGTSAFKVWAPRGPNSIEVFSWTIVEKDMPEEFKQRIARAMNFIFGTAGILESDDSDNMETMTQLNRGYMTRQGMLNSQMGIGLDREDAEYPGIIGESAIGETSYRGFYRFYREILGAQSWDEIRANNSKWKKEMLDVSA